MIVEVEILKLMRQREALAQELHQLNSQPIPISSQYRLVNNYVSYGNVNSSSNLQVPHSTTTNLVNTRSVPFVQHNTFAPHMLVGAPITSHYSSNAYPFPPSEVGVRIQNSIYNQYVGQYQYQYPV